MKSRRGFTLIEMGVVLTVLVLGAAIVLPNIARWTEGNARRQFPDRLRRIFDSARERAIELKTEVVVRYNDADRVFTVTWTDASEGTEVSGPSIQLLDELEVGRLRLDGMDLTASEWAVTYFPDGSHESAAIELLYSEGTQVLRIASGRGARYTNGSVDDQDAPTWEAGALEERI